MTNSKERLEQILKHTGGSYNSLSKKIGLKRSQNLYDIRDGKIQNISFELAILISKAFPDLNDEWILTGEGEMLKSINDQAPSSPMISTDGIGVPMYNVPGSAGNIVLFNDIDSTRVVGHLNYPGATKDSIALPVHGNSMHPFLEDGSWAVLRPIYDRYSIVWGQVYRIEWGDYRMYKRLLVGENDDEVILWSDNQAEMINGSPIHAPIKIKKNEIIKLYLVTDKYKKANN